jgi:hypothetical protein
MNSGENVRLKLVEWADSTFTAAIWPKVRGVLPEFLEFEEKSSDERLIAREILSQADIGVSNDVEYDDLVEPYSAAPTREHSQEAHLQRQLSRTFIVAAI